MAFSELRIVNLLISVQKFKQILKKKMQFEFVGGLYFMHLCKYIENEGIFYFYFILFHSVYFIAKLSQSQPATLQLSLAEIALLSV